MKYIKNQEKITTNSKPNENELEYMRFRDKLKLASIKKEEKYILYNHKFLGKSFRRIFCKKTHMQITFISFLAKESILGH